MSTDNPETPESDDCAPAPDPGSGCDPQLIDDVRCNAKGVAAQAAYNATYQDLLVQAKIDYDTTRKTYRATRHDAALKVQDMRHQIKHVIDRIKCLIGQERVVRCLDKAFCAYVEELDTCGDVEGCCVGECEYDLDAAVDYDELVRLIAVYQHQADEAQACFTRLVGEPAALGQRVTDCKAAIDAINLALNAEPASTDLKSVYAQALVAERAIEHIWAGFDETHDFVECLCLALTCWTKGCEAVSVLTGAKAVQDCKRDAVAKHCSDIRANPVHEILAMYDKLCPPRRCPEDDEDEDEDSHHKDCHCHHHHHQHCRCHDRPGESDGAEDEGDHEDEGSIG